MRKKKSNQDFIDQIGLKVLEICDLLDKLPAKDRVTSIGAIIHILSVEYPDECIGGIDLVKEVITHFGNNREDLGGTLFSKG